MNPTRAEGAAQALEVIGVCKRFGNVVALDDVHLSVATGSVHALLGENGAGKSTLMRIVYGLVRPDAGDVRLFGTTAATHSVRHARNAGVGMVHQHLSLVPALTAAENLSLGGGGFFQPRAATALLRRTAERFGLDVRAQELVRDLGIVEQQRLEILKALARGAKLLILDEPTTGLAPSEIDELLRWIRAFADAGGSVVLVTHKLREALSVADDVTVLRHGRVVNTGATHGRSEQDLARAVFPDAPDVVAEPWTGTQGEPVVIANHLGVRRTDAPGGIDSATFRIHRGEVVGIAAIEGSGHRELLESLTGHRRPDAGTLQLPARLAVIPAHRMRDALIAEFSLTENVALHGAGQRRGRLDWTAFTERTAALMERFRIVAPSPAARAGALSGGNQQRLVVARELEQPVDLVIADDPTRGLDLRAAAFVHQQLRGIAASGAGVVVHCSDLDELLALATRVLVVFHGTVAEVPRNRTSVGRAMLGAPS